MPTHTANIDHRPLPRLVLLARDIKLSHSVFALPFALLAGFLAAGSQGELPAWPLVGLIVLCMVFARTVAMTANRLADHRLDADNPRTARRAIPSGQLSVSYVLGMTILCAALFVVAASGFWWLGGNGNPWPLILSPFVLGWLVLYSFTKRFTWMCHLFLGSALAMSPVAAAIAIEPAYLAQPAVYLLALMVTCWVAGFDVIYALQDVAVDREAGLFSMPARLGEEPALWISRGLHLTALGSLVAMGLLEGQLGLYFGAGVVIVGGLLVLEHALVWRSNTNRIHIAFLTVNGVISLLLGGLGIVDVVRGVW